MNELQVFSPVTVCTVPQHTGIKREKKVLEVASIDLRTEFGRKRRYLIRIVISEGGAKQKQWNKKLAKPTKELAEINLATVSC